MSTLQDILTRIEANAAELGRIVDELRKLVATPEPTPPVVTPPEPPAAPPAVAGETRKVGMKEAAWSIERDGTKITNPVLLSGHALIVVNSGRHSGIVIKDAKLFGPHQYGIYLSDNAGSDLLIDGLTNWDGQVWHEGWPGVRVEGGIRCEGASGEIRNVDLSYKAASPLRLNATHPSGAPLLVRDSKLRGDHLAVGPLDSSDSPLTPDSLARRANVELRNVSQKGAGLYLAAGANLTATDCTFDVTKGKPIEGKFLWGWPGKETAQKKTAGVRRPAVVARFVRCRFSAAQSLPARNLSRNEWLPVMWGSEPLPASITFENCTLNGRVMLP
jgi:hypothetical protein